MKRILLTLAAVVICLNVTSRDVVTKLAKNYEENKPELFWYKLGKEHPQIKAMKSAIEQNKPAMQIVTEALGDLSPIRIHTRKEALRGYGDLILFLYNITGIRNVYSDVEFFVVKDSEMNAGMNPEGTCHINTGLIENASNTEEIVAVVAHEIAHYVLWHTINDCWRTAKAIRRNQTWAEIGTGLAIGLYGASQIYNAQYGVQQSNQAQQQTYNNLASVGIRIREEIGLRTDKITRLRYMRETEDEADETAFWFLEKNGIDPIHLISFFKKLDAQTPSYLKQQKKNEKYSDHSDMANRIKRLEVLYKKFHNKSFSQKSLPALSSLIPITDLKTNNVPAPKVVNIDGVLLYFDSFKIAHSDFKCESLQSNGFSGTVEAKSLTEEPTSCGCVAEELRNTIHMLLSSHTSLSPRM